MSERRYMRYTPIDIMHRLRTRLKHTCMHADQPIRSADLDLEYEMSSIHCMLNSIAQIQEDLCEMYSPEEGLREEIDDMLDHIMDHLDNLHYMLRDRASLSGGLHNKEIRQVRSEIHKAINEHLTRHHDIYGAYKLAM